MVEMSRILFVFSANVIIKLIKCYFFSMELLLVYIYLTNRCGYNIRKSSIFALACINMHGNIVLTYIELCANYSLLLPYWHCRS